MATKQLIMGYSGLRRSGKPSTWHFGVEDRLREYAEGLILRTLIILMVQIMIQIMKIQTKGRQQEIDHQLLAQAPRLAGPRAFQITILINL